jgi:hypothetical protein
MILIMDFSFVLLSVGSSAFNKDLIKTGLSSRRLRVMPNVDLVVDRIAKVLRNFIFT